jgi:hypothetical protein
VAPNAPFGFHHGVVGGRSRSVGMSNHHLDVVLLWWDGGRPVCLTSLASFSSPAKPNATPPMSVGGQL